MHGSLMLRSPVEAITQFDIHLTTVKGNVILWSSCAQEKASGSRDLVLESDDEFDGSVEIMLLDDSDYLCWWIFVEKRKPCKKNTVDTVHVKETAMPNHLWFATLPA